MKDISLLGLKRAFDSHWAKSSNYVGILVDINGAHEVIINSNENFYEKMNYYEEAYDENLNHKHAKGIKVINYTFGNTFQEIEEDLLG